MADSRLTQLMRRDETVRRHAEEAPEMAQAQRHPIVEMQKQVGNAEVARMLAQRQEEEEEMQMKRDPALQRQDEEEEMQMKRDPQLQREEEEEELQMSRDPQLQREGEEEEEMQMKRDPAVGLEGGPAGSELTQAISSERGNGSPLGGAVRDKMESSFGTSFEDVRVHADETSDSLNRSVTAKAFTTGSDIFLRKDSSPGDEKLMAHELTHVVQQRSMAGGGGGSMQVGPADSHHEEEADAVASEVTSGAVERKEDE